MKFSELHSIAGCASFSPNGEYVASCKAAKLYIKTTSSLTTLQVYACRDAIDFLEWSSDSMYILCANFKRGLVEVWSLEDPEWHCRIDEGAAGLDHVMWAPDGRHILTTAQFQLRITIWSLVSQHVSYIRFPKHARSGACFSPDAKFLSVLERKDCKDYLSIFDCSSWQMVLHFATGTTDAADVSWSPDNQHIAVWDCNLYYKINVFSLQGVQVGSYTAYEDALGIKGVTWSPSAQLLAVGSYDQSVRLLNNLTWSKVVELKHKHAVQPARTLTVYQEQMAKDTKTRSYQIQAEGHKLDSVKLDPEKPDPKVGVAWLRFSCSSRYLACRNDQTPSVLYVWDIAKLRCCAIMEQLASLRDGAWHPHRQLLAYCSGSNVVYFWSPDGASCVQLPLQDKFPISSLEWTADGTALLLRSRDKMCLCFPGDEV
eukprot:TRINITY_DN5257_c0_g1_i2.p1 TRINITY_DN5257_c0_g1~~TRINITY_DN5257_c0_g1_i2.p1  ORF type:complete len:428 (+),score=77.70 TRINITY_DN5257_c0_g1_i2:87-1370(+)